MVVVIEMVTKKEEPKKGAKKAEPVKMTDAEKKRDAERKKVAESQAKMLEEHRKAIIAQNIATMESEKKRMDSLIDRLEAKKANIEKTLKGLKK